MSMFMESSRAQTTSGPTVTSTVSIVPGSTSLISIPKATSINLTSDFISGLIPSITSTISSQQQTPEIIFVTASSSSVSNSSSTGIPVPTINNDSPNSNKLSSTDLGAIIGGCAGGLLFITIVTVLCCIRRKKMKPKKEYDLGRGISASMIFSKDAYKQQPERGITATPNSTNPTKPPNNNDPTIKRYNIATQEDTKLDRVITPPVILYSDVQDNIMIMQENPQQRRQKRGASEISKGARLSKYNFLSQAFSQMRTSYGGGGGGGGALQGADDNEYHIENQQEEQIAAPEPAATTTTKKSGDRTYQHDSMVLSPYEFITDQEKQLQPPKKYQMYSMYEKDSTVEALSPIPSQSTFFDPHRESTMTVGTLHAPLFQQQQQQQPAPPTPPIINKHLYTSGVVTPNMDRDSVVSDVSQYSAFPLPNNNNTSSQTPTTMMMNSKPYPYF